MPAHVESAQEMAEAALEQITPKNPPRGKSKYMRRALVRVGSLSPETFETFKPKNMFEKAAMNLFKKASKSDKADAVAAFREIKETLGERVGSNWKDTQESNRPSVQITNDVIPFATRKAAMN